MILRVFRGAINPGQRERMLAHLRDAVYPALAGIPGLRSFQAGLRTGDDGAADFAIITTWEDFEGLLQAVGGQLDRPRWMRAVEDIYTPLGVEHFELVGEDIKGVFPLEGAILRVFEGRLAPRAAETFFDFARRRQAELLDEGLIVASHIGRRMVGTAEEVIYVVLWRDTEAIAALGGDPDRPAAQSEWGQYFESWRLGGYDALTRVEPRTGSEPALLLADDERRYLFATNAAAQLIGRPPGRILGKRIDDLTVAAARDDVDELWQRFIAEGTQAGEYELAARDGETRRVSFAARANTPWPGAHTSLLGPPGTELDGGAIDRALAEIGILARYPVTSG